MSFLDDKPKHSERTMTQTIVFVVGLILLAFLFAMFESDNGVRWYELSIGILAFFIWLGLLIWIGHAKK
ncbi:MAG: hypothetical protein COU68_00535 [Candidatus Pacebacteria bacterium CG10_big_fil_rev_8_21_14_0_10_45_6]|nr:MAG: hypothetical protein COU68_00535 [Candidatus Pacebacteria bacterium CG10_big_fil_rev_8_21_14_0_10_45_6]